MVRFWTFTLEECLLCNIQFLRIWGTHMMHAVAQTTRFCIAHTIRFCIALQMSAMLTTNVLSIPLISFEISRVQGMHLIIHAVAST